MGAELLFSVISTLGGLLSSLRNSGSTTSDGEGDGIERDLGRLERLLKRIQAALHDAAGREIQKASVKLWIKEIQAVAYEAEDILDEWQYELLRLRIESEETTSPWPEGMHWKIEDVLGCFDELSENREALYLSEHDREMASVISTVCDLLIYLSSSESATTYRESCGIKSKLGRLERLLVRIKAAFHDVDNVLKTRPERSVEPVKTETGLSPSISKNLVRRRLNFPNIRSTLLKMMDTINMQMSNLWVVSWLMKLEDAVYMAEEFLDECLYKLLHLKIEESGETTSSSSAGKRNRHLEGVMPDEMAERIKGVIERCLYKLLHVKIEESGEAIPSSSAGRKKKNLEGAMPDGMAERIKGVMDRFKEISKDKEALFLREDDGERCGLALTCSLPTSHMVTESVIFGRDVDKNKVLDLLMGNRGESRHISVIAIVGMGGIGKTTLAQLVYNDSLIRCSFDASAWVYISPQFDVTRAAKEVLESISENNNSGLIGLSAVQKAIVNEIEGKNIFLVLDDVWDELPNKWEQFLAPLRVAASMKILVTTRDKAVAQIVQATYTYDLKCLPQDQCNLLFERHAFGGQFIDDSSRFREISAQIVKKCAGLPLAIKCIGRALSCNMCEDHWRDILESGLWESHGKNEIFPALKISYYSLPPELKPCLLFCSLFPKGHRFLKDEIIYMWIALGYIQSRGNKSEIVMGNEFIHELDRRSFLMLDIQRWKETFTLHDLIHDLGRSISINQFCTNTRACIGRVISSEVHHECVISSEEHRVNSNTNLRVLELCEVTCAHVLEHAVNLKHLRYLALKSSELERLPKSTTLLFNLVALKISFIDHLKELPINIGKLVNLRFLSIISVGIKRLPESLGQLSNLQILLLCACPQLRRLPIWIGNLINLQKLYISNTKITKLPESCCMLGKLQTLVLEGCYKMRLPDDFGNLINLRCMYVEDGHLGRLPESITQLCNQLEVLELWIHDSLIGLLCRLKGFLNNCSLNISVFKGKEILIEEKKPEIESNIPWENVILGEILIEDLSIPVSLHQKNFICIRYRKFESFIETVQPLNHLIKLKVNGKHGIVYPRWIGAKKYGQVAIFMQSHLRNCKFFAKFGQLPLLRSLTLIGGTLGDDFSQIVANHDFKVIFPSLEEIEFRDMLEWNHPFSEHYNDLHTLHSLKIDNCPKLSSVPMFAFLRRLEIIKCSFSRLELDTLHCQPLESLHIEECLELTLLLGLQSLNSLRALYIVQCPQLEGFTYQTILNLPLSIEIVECPNLKSWCQCQQLNYIEISSCKMLQTSSFRNILKQRNQKFLLEYLEIEKSTEKCLALHEGLGNLLRLEIKSCWKLETLKGLSELKKIRRLVLWDCPLLSLGNANNLDDRYVPPNLRDQVKPIDGRRSYLPPFLTSLVILGCHRILSLDLLQLKHPSEFMELEITNCKQLTYIGGLHQLTNLETLAIIQCPRLQLELLPVVPDCVVISGCPRLNSWCQMHSIEPFDEEM